MNGLILLDMNELINKLLGEKLSSIIGKNIDKAIENIEFVMNNNILEYLSEECNRNIQIKTLLHRAYPVSLFDIYQPLYIVPSQYWKRDTSESKISTSSIQELFKKHQYITLKGTAGSGKSTIVKYLFVNAIQTKFKIPIKIELRYLNDYKGNIISFIQDKIFKFQKLTNSDNITEKLMQSGDFVFFLDGYDEIISTKKQQITKDIDDLVKRYNKNNYMLTSRPFTDIETLPLFYNYDVCDLSDDDIDEFIIKQIPKQDEELCKKIIEAVHNQENKDYKTFLSNPLLLSMFILTFQSYSNIPQKRSDFYSQVFETLFSLHDSISKMAFVREKQSGLSKENIIEILRLFSFLSYFDEKFTFSLQYIEDKLQLIKDKKKISFENQKLMQDLQVAIGIITQEGTEYTYPHRSLQEYFAASYIASLSEYNKEKIYQKIYKTFIKETKWRNREYDNFYLLLSELDKRAIINYTIIPFLCDAIDSIKMIDNMNYTKIIDLFITLENTYFSINNILLEKKIFMQEEMKYNRFFKKRLNEEYKKDKESTKTSTIENDTKFNKIREKTRKELTMQYIVPFLKEYINNIQNTLNRLKLEIDNDEAIDADFINLA
jgi:predicted ATPase